MNPTVFQTLTSENLKNGTLEPLLPEIYELKNIVENSPPWHLNQNVFDHTVKTLAALESFLSSPLSESVASHLNQALGKCTRLEILKLSTILHDMAKDRTLLVDDKGITRCPSHEIVGGSLVNNFTGRFDLNKQSYEAVFRIVTFHGVAHETINFITNGKNETQAVEMFKGVAEDLFIELTLLTMADLYGEDLDKSNPQELTRRIALLSKILIS